MSDDELLQSLDTYACQLREANAKLIYAAKARIEALRGEVEELKDERDGADRDRAWAMSQRAGLLLRAEAAEAERDRLSGEVERLKEERDAARDDEELMSKAKQLCEAERDRLKAAITTHVAGCVACGGSGVAFLCPERDDTAEAVREDCEECVGLRKALGDAS